MRNCALGTAAVFVLLSTALAQTTQRPCIPNPAAPVQSGPSTANYVASIIPTPGLTNSSIAGTSGVRCAADASKSGCGQGESLNQSPLQPPNAPRPAATTSSSLNQVAAFVPTGGSPSIAPLLPFGSAGSYQNLLCNNHSLGAEPALSGMVPAAVSGPAATATVQVIPGSQNFTLAALANGGQVLAWLTPDSSILNTAIVNTDGKSYTRSNTYTVGPNGQQVTAADFNGDGIVDLAVSSYGSLSTNTGGNIRIFLGKGDGTFNVGPVVNIDNTVSLFPADLNGDDKADLVAGNVNGAVVVLLGNGDGTFRSPVSYSVKGSPQSVIAADFNGDGRLDLAVTTLVGGVLVYLGNGDGSFRQPTIYPGGDHSRYIASTDLNADGKPDLIVASTGSNSVLFYLGNGDGTFQTPSQYVVGSNIKDFGLAIASDGVLLFSLDELAGGMLATSIPSTGIAAAPVLYSLPAAPTGVATADLNGDKSPDIVVANGGISVLLRTPNGGFKTPVNYPLQSGSQAVAILVGDLNGDGRPDVIAASTSNQSNNGTIDVALGNGDGTLGRQNSYPIGGYPGGTFGNFPSGLALGDFNGDGKLDVAAAFQSAQGESSPGGISVLLGNGDGTLRSAVNYSVGSSLSVFAMAAADLNGDGKLDLLAGVGTSFISVGSLALLAGKGDGTFQAAATIAIPVAGTPIALALGDVNGDGKLDIVASIRDTNFNNTIVVLLGNGGGTFRALPPLPVDASADSIAMLDLNADGIPDIVVGDCCGFTEALYLLGKGDGTFLPAQYFPAGSSATAFATANWNNDGVAGLAVALQGGFVTAVESGLDPKLIGTGGGPTPLQLVSAAGGVPALAPGSLTTAFGSGLTNGSPVVTSLPWPQTVNGTSVTITDSTGQKTTGPLTYVSSGQVNFQIPDSVATGTATIAIDNNNGATSSAQATLKSFAPALFTLNTANLAAAVAVCVAADGSTTVEYPYQTLNGALVAQPLNLGACTQTILLLFGTGFDTATAVTAKVSIGGVPAAVQYAGPQGTFPGLNQINLVIPQSLAGKGSVPVVLNIGTQSSNTATITLQ